jgi:hypothetical protein
MSGVSARVSSVKNSECEHTEGMLWNQERDGESFGMVVCFSCTSSPKVVVTDDMGRTESSLGEQGEEGAEYGGR